MNKFDLSQFENLLNDMNYNAHIALWAIGAFMHILLQKGVIKKEDIPPGFQAMAGSEYATLNRISELIIDATSQEKEKGEVKE